MTQKTADFLSSFGIMLVGVTLVFAGSVLFTHAKVDLVAEGLPLSEKRIVAENQLVRSRLFPVSHAVVPMNHGGGQFETVLTAASIVVVDDKTNTILYKKNSSDIRSLASITKLMSALVLNELPIMWTRTTFVTGTDINEDHHVAVGEQYSLNNLWNIGLVGSSNSAIKALVRNSGMSEEAFVKRMNAKAQELGLFTLRFVEPTGLDERNMGSPVDVAKLLKYALEVPKISKALALGEYTAIPLNTNEKHRVWSTNWLLNNWVPNTFNKASIVGKTGYITDSGYNFAVRIANNKDQIVRVVIMGATTNEFRFSEARDVAEWVFENFSWPQEHVATAETP